MESADAIHLARRTIEARRAVNNVLFMDWWEMSMNCPHCRSKARAYQGAIRAGDLAVSEANKPTCE